MPAHPATIFAKCGFIAAAAVFGGSVTLAQEDVEQAADDDVIDEIIVYGGEKRGDPVDIEALYEEMMRDRLMLEQDQLRALQEENEWRNSASTTVENPSRIQWGYDPADELRMRRESNLSDVEFVTTKPATVFRIGF